MISITQYRAAIGCWYLKICSGYSSSHKTSINSHCSHFQVYFIYIQLLCLCLSLETEFNSALYLCFLLLVASGDIHPNPGPTPLNSEIGLCHLNARSLLKSGRLEEMYLELCCLHRFDIIGVSESHLSQEIPDLDINIQNYTIYRQDRNRHGGGTALYIHDRFTSVRRPDLELPNIELLWVELKFYNHSVLVGVCYRPPNQCAADVDAFIDNLNNSLSSIVGGRNQSVILLGDFNDRCHVWDSDHSDSEIGLKLVNLVRSHNMFQLINKPTRNNNLLDLLITDSPGYFLVADTLPPIDNLDHSIIYGTLNLTPPKIPSYKRKVWQYDRGNWLLLNNLFLLTDWDALFSSSPYLNDLTTRITHFIIDTAETCIPTRLVTIRPRDKPGMTSEVRRLFKIAKRMHKRARHTCDPVHIEIFRNARRDAKSSFRKARSKFFNDISEKLLNPTTNNKAYWKLNKLVYGDKTCKSIPDLLDGTSLKTDSWDKAMLFNKFFSEQCSLPDGSDADPLPTFSPVTESSLSSITTTAEEVRKLLRNLNVSKASGPDGISNRILRGCADTLCYPLSRLFNLSLQTGVFPHCWKLSNIVPIHKKNDRQVVSNYRPVSLLCTISKVLERIVHSRLYTYCSENNLLTEKNSGFKPVDSTVNQLTSITHRIYQALDNKQDACLVFLDISKAFDRVWHRGLVFKLRQFGVNGTLLNWFSSYLNNRSQQVIINGTTSEPLFITAGVPQGSILGPLLFLIYINDLVEGIQCDVNMFADDTFLFDTYTDPLLSSVRINQDLNTILRWGNIWKVMFNALKTYYMLISRKQQPSHYPNPTFNNIPIEKTECHKHLGLYFTSNFSWSEHINRTIVKASKRLHLMNSVRLLLPRRSLCSLYKTMILPILEYCNVIYDNCTLRDSLALDNVQRRAALICTGAYRHTSNESLLAELGWQPLYIRRQTHKLILLFKIVHSLTPAYLRRLLHQPAETPYGLRNRTNASLPVPYSRLSSTKNAFAHSAIKAWNSLPEPIRSCQLLCTFKQLLLSELYKQSNVKFLPKLYSFLPLGNATVYHCRLRLGLSALNSHRFSYNFIANKSCPKCNSECENVQHYLFSCPAYAAPRTVLMESLSNILLDDVMQNPATLENYLIYGSNSLNIASNLSMFSHVFNYITATGRFIHSS